VRKSNFEQRSAVSKIVRVAVAVIAIVALVILFIKQPTFGSAPYTPHSHADAKRLSRDVVALTSRARCADTP